MCTKRRSMRSERGASLVEAALVLPLLLLLFAGMIDLTRAMDTRISLMNASREGARYGAQCPNTMSEIVAVVQEAAANEGLPTGDISVTIEGLGGDIGDPIRVIASYDLPTLFGDILGMEAIPVSAQTAMVILEDD